MIQLHIVKFLQDKQKREGLERLAGLVLLIAIGLGFVLYTSAQNKEAKVDMVTKSTECYTVGVPKNYKVNVIGKNCQLAAYTGQSVKQATNLILLIPYDTKVATRQEAIGQFTKEAPQIKTYKNAKIDGKDSVYIEGDSSTLTKKTYNRFYVTYDIGPYKPTGKDFTATSIRTGFTLEPNNKDTIIPQVIDTIRWK